MTSRTSQTVTVSATDAIAQMYGSACLNDRWSAPVTTAIQVDGVDGRYIRATLVTPSECNIIKPRPTAPDLVGLKERRWHGFTDIIASF